MARVYGTQKRLKFWEYRVQHMPLDQLARFLWLSEFTIMFQDKEMDEDAKKKRKAKKEQACSSASLTPQS
jgi:hypothetical protein